MIELPGGFWAGWIVVLSVGSFAVLGWLIFSVYFQKGPPHEDVCWDESLTEGDAPAPMWWFWLVFTLMIFSVVYLILYPGLGSFAGVLEWSQGHHLEHARRMHEKEFAALTASKSELDSVSLARDRSAMASARSLYQTHCASCHGDDARGQANQYPDLSNPHWQWGADEAAVVQSIAEGRQAVMPGWGSVLNDQQIDAVHGYVMALAESRSPPADSLGGQVYVQTCAACHGAQAKGNSALGAPDLTDEEWLYGASPESVMRSIVHGRQGVMPAHAERLSAFQIRLLAVWLLHGNVVDNDSSAVNIFEPRSATALSEPQ